jgi:hypothetical protein
VNVIDAAKLGTPARMVRLLRPKAVTDGENARARHCYLAVAADRTLTVSLTDSEFAYEARLGVTGDADPWKATVRSGLAAAVLTRLSGVAAEKKVKKRPVAIDASDPEALTLTRGPFVASLPVQRLPNPFPALAPPGDGEWAPVPTSVLRKTLTFLAGTPGKDDTRDEHKECTLFADGLGMAACNRRPPNQDRADEAVSLSLVTGSPVLPFDLAATRHRAHRILRWLHVLPQEGPERVSELEVAQGSGASAGYYFLRDVERTYTLWFPAAERKYPRAELDSFRAAPVTFSGSLPRGPLTATLAAIRGELFLGWVSLAFRKAEKDWTLDLSVGDRPGVVVRNSVPVRVAVPPAGGATAVTLAVNPATLAAALKRIPAGRVQITHRASARLVSVLMQDTVETPGGTEIDFEQPTFQTDEVYFLEGEPATAPEPAPETAPHQASETPVALSEPDPAEV